MRIALLIIFFNTITIFSLFSQLTLNIEGTTVNNSETGMWQGVNIERSARTTFTYLNNSVTSVNAQGYMLQAGDEEVSAYNTNLNGEIISGNKFVWNGTDMTSVTHGVFTGYNINAVIKYNYLYNIPLSLIRKSNGMTNSSGGVGYNIVNRTPAVGGVAKGMNNVYFYNNTFYSDQIMYVSPGVGTWRGLIDIYSNTDITPSAPSAGAKIKNNIFYTKYQIYNIMIYDAACLPGFESDYNIFYCEAGTPIFNYMGSRKTFAEWQALGYDTHSRVINPNFIDFVNFVPVARLDYGTDLGSEWLTGLATNAVWTAGSAPAKTNQNGTWQVGARIYGTSSTVPVYTGAIVENATPNQVEVTVSLALANVIPTLTSFNVSINSNLRSVSSISISGTKVRLTLTSPVVYGDQILVSYTRPLADPLQTPTGETVESFLAKPVVNNCINRSPTITILSPEQGTSFSLPANITIAANASDADGTISKVEFYARGVKIGEDVSNPFSVVWTNDLAGTVVLSAVATDNYNKTSNQYDVEIYFIPEGTAEAEYFNLFPNPNSGVFTIEIINPLKNDINYITVADLSGKEVYAGVLLKEEVRKEIDLSNAVTGIYVLSVTGNGIITAKAFIKN